MEKIATAAREEFGIKILGFAMLLMTDHKPPSSAGQVISKATGILSRLKQRLSSGGSGNAKPGDDKPVWNRVYYMMDKPGRSLIFYSGPDRKKVVRSVTLKATLKVIECVDFAKQTNIIELRDHVEGSTFIALESPGEKRRWERDVREGVIGFRAPIPSSPTNRDDDEASYASSFDGDDERVGELYDLYSAQLRQERVAQLSLLLRNNQITQKEFDEACEIIATTPDPSSGKMGGIFLNDPMEDDTPDDDFGAQVQCPKCAWSNNTMFGRYTCVKCGSELPKPEAGVGETAEAWQKYQESLRTQTGAKMDVTKRGDGAVLGMKPVPLTTPFAKDMAFEDGRVACELIGSQKQIDFRTYQEIILFGIDVRFRDEVDAELEIGWVVSHRLDKFKALYQELVDGDKSSLIANARKKVPAFPDNLKDDDPNSVKKLEEWLTALFKLVPSGGKQTKLVYYDDDDDGNAPEPPPAEKPLHMLPSAWRSVKDPESGEYYYFNKITGETRWDNPFEEEESTNPATKDLLPDWEAVLDKESGDYYYWNIKTQETTWEKPVAPKTLQQGKRKLLDAKDLLHAPSINRFLDLKRNVQRLEELAL